MEARAGIEPARGGHVKKSFVLLCFCEGLLVLLGKSSRHLQTLVFPMANVSVYVKGQRKHWYVSYICARRLVRVEESSGFLLSDPQGKRKARDYATARAIDSATARGAASAESYAAWVEAWIKDHYRRRARTRDRYLGAWSYLRDYLSEEKVHYPRTLTYAHVLGYVDWRTTQRKKSSGRTPSRNTALLDIRVLAQVQREAIRRGFARDNPAARTGMQRDDSPEKPEITDEEVTAIRAALLAREGHLPLQDRWMSIAFEIGLHQGCRLQETSVDFRDIDLRRDTITFRAKGGKVFGTRIHPDLKPLLQQLRDTRAQRTCALPRLPSKAWWTFFREIRLEHLCFHCTRVTVVTRMARAGVPIQQAMAFVGHASELIHKIYQRLKPADLSACTAAVSYAASRSAGAPQPPAVPDSSGSAPRETPGGAAATP